MIFQVTIKPGAKKNEVLRQPDGSLKVLVKERAIEGRANEALREVMAEHFKVSKSKVIILRGLISKIKRLEIL